MKFVTLRIKLSTYPTIHCWIFKKSLIQPKIDCDVADTKLNCDFADTKGIDLVNEVSLYLCNEITYLN